jgi:hypothetical protein
LGYDTYIHGVPQGNSLCSYLKQIKMSFFSLIQNQRPGEWNRSCLGGAGTGGRGKREEMAKEGKYGANIVCTST